MSEEGPRQGVGVAGGRKAFSVAVRAVAPEGMGVGGYNSPSERRPAPFPILPPPECPLHRTASSEAPQGHPRGLGLVVSGCAQKRDLLRGRPCRASPGHTQDGGLWNA